MRKFLPVYLLLLVPFLASSQVTVPIVKANFGVDADLRANFFDGLILTGNDDWFRNNGTVGAGIIDTTGANFTGFSFAIIMVMIQPFFPEEIRMP
jgi:hypothetical protein